MTELVPMHRIVDGLAARAAELARTLLPLGHREGAEWREARRGAGGLGDSLSVKIAGAHPGVWYHGASDKGGDALDLIAFVACRDDKAAAIRWARAWLGLDGADPRALAATRRAVEQAPTAEADAADAERRRRRAHAIYLSGSAELAGTAVARYLAGRGLRLARLGFPVRALRHVARLDEQFSGRTWPAMVAPIVGADGAFLGVHRTYLAVQPDGSVAKAPIVSPAGKPSAKQTLGRYAGGAIRLWNGTRVDPKTGEILYGRRLSEAGDDVTIDLTEGIEDGLTVALSAPEARVLVGVSLGNMTRLALPPAVRRVVWWRQNDAPGSPAALSAPKVRARLEALGCQVVEMRMPEGVNDPNAYLQGGDHGDERAAG